MEQEPKEPLKLLPPADLPSEQSKEGFLRRALNRTREAFRNVDEAITGREAFRRIEERFERQTELNDSFVARLSDALDQVATLRSRLDGEIAILAREAAEQRATFERTAAEIASTASELRATAVTAEQTLAEANSKQTEIEKHAAAQLSRWNSDAETLKRDVQKLQNQVAQLQQSFKQFVITALITVALMAAIIVYLIFAR